MDGNWSDRWTRAELADRLAALGINGTSQICAAVLNQSPHPQTVALADTLGTDAAVMRGDYSAAGLLADAGACMNDDLAAGFCENGHVFCNCTGSGKCGDECD